MDRTEIAPAVVEALNALWDGADVELAPGDPQEDGAMWIEAAGKRYCFDVVLKRHVNVASSVILAQERSSPPERPIILISEYIQPSIARAMQQRGVNYADTAGNCHIQRPPLLLHGQGRKRPKSTTEGPIRAFAGEGLKVIFALLLEPELVRRSYRDLAGLTGASHGVVQYTFKDLERLEFVLKVGRSDRLLRDTDTLLDRWVAGFSESFRPRLELGRFRFFPADRPWDTNQLASGLERWGGESAASTVTQYLKPAKLTVYTRGSRADFMGRLRVVPDEMGEVELLRAFWSENLERELPSAFVDDRVPNVLTYADLIASGDSRNAEVAADLRGRIASGKVNG